MLRLGSAVPGRVEWKIPPEFSADNCEYTNFSDHVNHEIGNFAREFMFPQSRVLLISREALYVGAAQRGVTSVISAHTAPGHGRFSLHGEARRVR